MPPQRIPESPVAVAAATHLVNLPSEHRLSVVREPMHDFSSMIRRGDPRRGGWQRRGRPWPSGGRDCGPRRQAGRCQCRLDHANRRKDEAGAAAAGPWTRASAPGAAHLPAHAAAGIEPAACRHQVADTTAVGGKASAIDAAAREAAGQQRLAVTAGVGSNRLGRRLRHRCRNGATGKETEGSQPRTLDSHDAGLAQGFGRQHCRPKLRSRQSLRLILVCSGWKAVPRRQRRTAFRMRSRGGAVDLRSGDPIPL
jgi:hypothetical protein